MGFYCLCHSTLQRRNYRFHLILLLFAFFYANTSKHISGNDMQLGVGIAAGLH